MDHLLRRVISALCADVATPLSARVNSLVEKDEWTELLSLRVSPRDYTDPEVYFRDAVVVDLLRKVEDLPTDVDRERKAVETFFACERMNASTNARLSRFVPGSELFESTEDERLYQFIGTWRKEVARVMGNLPATLTPRFSRGATYGDTGVYTTAPDKMSGTPQITSDARCLLPLYAETSWFRALAQERPYASDPSTVEGNIFFTVPKDATKRRGCCKEPSLNVAYQLDIGRLLKHRIKAQTGVDLRQGQALHRRLAQSASANGRLATIDMSNASDTVCRVLPKLVLHSSWYALLNSLRSKKTFIQGQWVYLEKFSSMGNGFTFELETILFLTLARVVATAEGADPDMVSCYGDDLIVPVEITETLLAALKFFGFEPNMEKSFWEGPFRESCGGDFFSGVNVRTHFLKELPDEPSAWISLANGIRRMAFQHDGTAARWQYLKRAWSRCLDAIPSDIRRCRGPAFLGDLVIWDREDAWEVREQAVRGEGRHALPLKAPCVATHKPIKPILPWKYWSPLTQLSSALIGVPSSGVTPRGDVAGFRRVWMPIYGVCDPYMMDQIGSDC